MLGSAAHPARSLASARLPRTPVVNSQKCAHGRRQKCQLVAMNAADSLTEGLTLTTEREGVQIIVIRFTAPSQPCRAEAIMSAIQGADQPSRHWTVATASTSGRLAMYMSTATEVHVDGVAPDSQASLPEVTRTPEVLNVPQDESRGKAHPARLVRALLGLR